MSELSYPVPSDSESKIIVPKTRFGGLLSVPPRTQVRRAFDILKNLYFKSHSIRTTAPNAENYPVFIRLWENHKGDYRGYGVYALNLYDTDSLADLDERCEVLHPLAFDPNVSKAKLLKVSDYLDRMTKPPKILEGN